MTIESEVNNEETNKNWKNIINSLISLKTINDIMTC